MNTFNGYKPVFLHRIDEGNKVSYLVTQVQAFDYKSYDASWMDDPMFQGDVSTPDIDLVREVEDYSCEQQALRAVAELYAEQLKADWRNNDHRQLSESIGGVFNSDTQKNFEFRDFFSRVTYFMLMNACLDWHSDIGHDDSSLVAEFSYKKITLSYPPFEKEANCSEWLTIEESPNGQCVKHVFQFSGDIAIAMENFFLDLNNVINGMGVGTHDVVKDRDYFFSLLEIITEANNIPIDYLIRSATDTPAESILLAGAVATNHYCEKRQFKNINPRIVREDGADLIRW